MPATLAGAATFGAVALGSLVLTFLRDALTLVRYAVAPVGDLISLVGNPLTPIGHLLTFVGNLVAPIRCILLALRPRRAPRRPLAGGR